jgi:hypothetical protein
MASRHRALYDSAVKGVEYEPRAAVDEAGAALAMRFKSDLVVEAGAQARAADRIFIVAEGVDSVIRARVPRLQ